MGPRQSAARSRNRGASRVWVIEPTRGRRWRRGDGMESNRPQTHAQSGAGARAVQQNRTMAIVQVAIHDAINAVTREHDTL